MSVFNHMMMQFFIEYKDDIKLNHDHVRNLKKIAINYIQTDFKMDFIPLIPMQLISLPRNRGRLFYLVKIVRLLKGLKILDTRIAMRYI